MELWARLGATIEVPDELVKEFVANPKEGIIVALQQGRVTLEGETYFPDIDDNDVVGLGEHEMVFFSRKIFTDKGSING